MECQCTGQKGFSSKHSIKSTLIQPPNYAPHRTPQVWATNMLTWEVTLPELTKLLLFLVFDLVCFIFVILDFVGVCLSPDLVPVSRLYTEGVYTRQHEEYMHEDFITKCI